MLSSITSVQLTEWMAYYSLEPWGEWRADLRMARIAALLANINRDTERKPEPYTEEDFMLEFDESKTEQGVDMRTKIMSLAAVFGGAVTHQ